MKNFMFDVAFTLEGPWEEPDDVPVSAQLAGLARRLADLIEYHANKSEDVSEAFGFCDSYDIEKPTP